MSDYFNTPYTNKFTDFNISPYDNSFTPDVPYTGKNLSADIMKIVEEFQPDYLVYPHPNDRHLDHWATNAFVKYTLNKIGFCPSPVI